jgi:prepilin-type N-terminal cleavage/methylation domain-containing protein
MNTRNTPTGFSLVELLLAIFILGIGIIAVAAIFPAGIAQQQRTRDDVMGPIVAAQGLNLLRTKMSQEDFGTFEQFDLTASNVRMASTVGNDNLQTVSGDWGWMRPSFVLDGPSMPSPNQLPEANRNPDPLDGAIDIFGLRHTRSVGGMTNRHPATLEEDTSSSFYTSDFADMGTYFTGFCPTPVSPSLDPDFQSEFDDEEAQFLAGIPFNRNKYLILDDFLPSGDGSLDDHTDPLREGRSEPLFTVTQSERGWPRGVETPEYFWDCMFRRYQGRVQVAIFVYRVGSNGGEQLPYAVCHQGAPASPDPVSGVAIKNPRESPLPARVDFPSPGDRWYPEGDPTPDDNPLNNLTIPGTLPSGSVLSQLDPYANGWQQAGQWLIDQNGTVHRVLSGRDNGAGGPVRLTSQVPYIPVMDVNGNLNNATPGLGVNNTARANVASAVKSIWFIPPETRNGFTLTPVYATVGEL